MSGMRSGPFLFYPALRFRTIQSRRWETIYMFSGKDLAAFVTACLQWNAL